MGVAEIDAGLMELQGFPGFDESEAACFLVKWIPVGVVGFLREIVGEVGDRRGCTMKLRWLRRFWILVGVCGAAAGEGCNSWSSMVALFGRNGEYDEELLAMWEFEIWEFSFDCSWER
ncbi:hypothetical protein Droror1_Dr00024371 [Drosera rotundifolia]